MTTLIIIRHGESETNRSNTFTGQLDVNLTELGILQAKKASRYICDNFKVDAVYSSDLKRAYNTALPIAEHFGLDIITTKEIREIYAGEWQGIPFDQLDSLYPEDRAIYNQIKSYSRCTGGESFGEVYDRSVKEFLRIAAENDGKTVVAASHGAPVRSFICYSLGYDADSLPKAGSIKNTSIHVFEVDGSNAKVIKTNIDEHLTMYGDEIFASGVGKEA
jgi:broad specificity phosphatase PhoE